jgi:hypothetical protein
VLSTPVLELRRLVERVEGVVTFRDGTTRSLDPGALRAAPEGALRWLSLAMPALAVGLLAARLA